MNELSDREHGAAEGVAVHVVTPDDIVDVVASGDVLR
jgi:hypothetical protein